MANAPSRKASLCLVLLLVLHPLQGFVSPYWQTSTGGTPNPAIGFASASLFSSRRIVRGTKMRRRTSEPNTKGVSATKVEGTDNDGDDIQAKEKKALDSVKSCYRMALLAAVIGAVTTLADEMEGAFDLFKFVKLFEVMHRFVFGFGLRRVWRIYDESSSGSYSISAQAILDLTQTMKTLWQQSAIVITMGAMVLSTSIEKSKYEGSGAVFNWISRTMLERPGAITLAISVLMVVPLTNMASKSAREAEAMGKPAGPGYDKARSMGFAAARNMRYCMGAFALLGFTQLVTALVKTSKTAIGLGLLDVLESVTIGGLLAKLNSSFLKAVMTATEGRNTKPEDYLDLYEAQSGFYSKIASVFRSQSFFKALPYAITAGKTVVGLVKG